MAGIREIAKACGVSISTVSNILNGKPGASKETTSLVLEKVKEMNYRPNYVAKNLAQRNTKIIGVITEDLTVFTSAEIVDGVNEYFENNQYQLVLTNLRLHKKYKYRYYTSNDYEGRVREELEEMLAKRAAGIVYIGGHERLIQCLPEDFPIPIVVAYGFTAYDHIPSVVVGDEQGGYDATKFLLEHGHRDIGILAGEPSSFHMQARLNGMLRAFYEYDVVYNPHRVVYGDWERTSGYQGTKELMKQDITAIFSMNDMMAGGAYQYIQEQGLEVGKDISMIGYDNREFSRWFVPELTTICLPLHDIGFKAANVLLDMIQKKEVQKEYQVTGDLIERGSVTKR